MSSMLEDGVQPGRGAVAAGQAAVVDDGVNGRSSAAAAVAHPEAHEADTGGQELVAGAAQGAVAAGELTAWLPGLGSPGSRADHAASHSLGPGSSRCRCCRSPGSW